MNNPNHVPDRSDGGDERADDILRLQMALDLADRDEREIVQSLPPATAEDLALVRAVLAPRIAARRAAQVQSPGRGQSVLTRLLQPLAALLLVSVAVYAWLFGVSGRDAEQGERFLGEAETGAGMTPAGRVAGSSYSPFRWLCPAPRAGRFRVEVYSAEGLSIHVSDEVEAMELRLDETVERSLPDHIIWELHILDHSGNTVRSLRKSASRSGS